MRYVCLAIRASVSESAMVLELSLTELIDALGRRKVTALEVLRAYRARAELIQEACNAVACWIPEAEAHAREAAPERKRSSRAKRVRKSI